MPKEMQWLTTTLATTPLLAFPYVPSRIAARGLAGA